MAIDQTLLQGGEELQHAREQSLERTRPAAEVPGFEPVRSLGSGAYGEVWLAIERNTRRKVAIKFYTHRGGLDWSLLSREVEKLSFLFADRYVVQLIDVGWDADPPYYVMEFVEGGSLAERLRHGPLPPDEAVSLFHDVAVGLVHAHGKGVLHCDLTPGNVLIDQDGKPRLADFGQSRMSYEQTPALGTLFYMAPEQADLHAVPDARWDVYALGALLYAMLTGHPPYRNPDTTAQMAKAADLPGKLRTYVQLLHTLPAPVEHRRVRGVDRELADIVSRSLATNPAKRYANPQAVLDALRAREQRRRRRPLLVLGVLGPAVLMLVIAALAGNAAWVAFQRSEQALIARSIENCRFAARFVAFTTAGQINRRWYILEREASDPDFRAVVLPALGRQAGSPERETLQQTVAFLHATHPEISAAHWFLLDARGIELARSPFDPALVGRSLAHRDFFHGLGRDLPEDTPNLPPIESPHRSHLYVADDGQERRMALSVPVWDSNDLDQRKVIGVLGISVPLGHFAELHMTQQDSGEQMPVLVDDLPDGCHPPRRGAILEHPQLDEALRAVNTACPQLYVDAATVERMGRLRSLRTQEESPAVDKQIDALSATDDYFDPLNDGYTGRWLAAFEPVIVANRPEATRDTGLVVIVQERFDAAVLPARQLAARLLRTGLIALAVVLVVITALWAFVVIVLNDAPRVRRAQRRLAQALPLPGAAQEPSTTATTSQGSAIE